MSTYRLEFIALVLLGVGALMAGKRGDEQLHSVTKIFISGASEAADGARKTLRGTKT